jgi:sugar lactone lactonase YvrE
MKGTRVARVLRSACVLAVLAAVAVPVSARADAGPPPTFIRQLGSSGDAEIYPSGAEIDPSDGSYVVADTGNDRVKRYDAGGTLQWNVGGFGSVLGKFNDPRDVGIDDAGNIYVADTGNARIVKMNAAGTSLAAWKGDASDKIGSPIGVTVSLYTDRVYVADAAKKKVRVFSTGGTVLDVFGDPAGCPFSALRDVDAGPDGSIYVANYLKNNIVHLDGGDGHCLTGSTWGSKGVNDGQFKNPYGVRVALDPALNGGTGAPAVFVADSNNNRVQEFSLTGTFIAKFGTTGTPAGAFAGLRRVAVSPPFACDWGQCINVAGSDLWGWKLGVWETNSDPSHYTFTTTVPNPIVPPAGEAGRPFSDPITAAFNEPRGITFDANGDLRVVDTVNQRLVWITPDGRLPSGSGTWTKCGFRGWTPGAFNWPRSAAVDPATGSIWVADTKQSRLQVVKPDCSGAQFLPAKAAVGSGTDQFNWPYGIAMGTFGNTAGVAFVADTKNNRVKAYNVATKAVIDVFGTKGAGNGQFNFPSGIAASPVDNHVFVTDRNNNRAVELQFSNGQFSWVRNYTGALHKPEGLAADTQGRLYVADSVDNQVVIFHTTGPSIGTIHATLNGFLSPQGVAVDDNGCIYVSDTYNDRVMVYAYESSCV